MKKIFLSILILLVSIFTFGAFAKAFEIIGPGGQTSGYTMDDIVVKVSIIAYDGRSSASSSSDSLPDSSLGALGHAFILVENKTELNVTMCGETISPYGAMSFGTYGNLTPTGLWVNQELLVSGGKTLNNVAVLSKNVKFRNQFDVSDALESITHWGSFENCAYYAANVWNLAFNDNLNYSIGALATPTALYTSMHSRYNCADTITLPRAYSSHPFNN